MNVLLGFVAPTAGDAYLFGVSVRQPIARQRIGYLPELTYYYKFLTAEELLRFYAKIFRIPKAEVGRRIDEVLQLVELEEARKRPIRTYSKGMQQRVGLAQALINNPDLLILDEPTRVLDPHVHLEVTQTTYECLQLYSLCDSYITDFMAVHSAELLVQDMYLAFTLCIV